MIVRWVILIWRMSRERRRGGKRGREVGKKQEEMRSFFFPLLPTAPNRAPSPLTSIKPRKLKLQCTKEGKYKYERLPADPIAPVLIIKFIPVRIYSGIFFKHSQMDTWPITPYAFRTSISSFRTSFPIKSFSFTFHLFFFPMSEGHPL